MAETKTFMAEFVHVRHPAPDGQTVETAATTDESGHGITINRFDKEKDEVWVAVGAPGSQPYCMKLQGQQFLMVLAVLNQWAADMGPGVGDVQH